jgi:hypothetical protein
MQRRALDMQCSNHESKRTNSMIILFSVIVIVIFSCILSPFCLHIYLDGRGKPKRMDSNILIRKKETSHHQYVLKAAWYLSLAGGASSKLDDAFAGAAESPVPSAPLACNCDFAASTSSGKSNPRSGHVSNASLARACPAAAHVSNHARALAESFVTPVPFRYACAIQNCAFRWPCWAAFMYLTKLGMQEQIARVRAIEEFVTAQNSSSMQLNCTS